MGSHGLRRDEDWDWEAFALPPSGAIGKLSLWVDRAPLEGVFDTGPAAVRKDAAFCTSSHLSNYSADNVGKSCIVEPFIIYETNTRTAARALSETIFREALERLRWPEGPVCPHCEAAGPAIAKVGGTVRREGLFSCSDCRGQFTLTVGTPLAGIEAASEPLGTHGTHAQCP
jgi:hypothetical protein